MSARIRKDKRTNPQPTELCVIAKQRHGIDRSILAFSCGKDSLAAWVAMRDAGIEVIPVYHYVFPHLSFVDEYIDYCEDFFGTRVIQMPHPWLDSLLHYGVMVAPHNYRALAEGDYKRTKGSFERYMRMLRKELNEPDLWYGVGVKACDSFMRSQVVSRCGGFDEVRSKWYPCAYASDRTVMATLRMAGVKLPKYYDQCGRSWDGLNYQHCKVMRIHYPEDWRRVLEVFPFLEAQEMRANLRTAEIERLEKVFKYEY